MIHFGPESRHGPESTLRSRDIENFFAFLADGPHVFYAFLERTHLGGKWNESAATGRTFRKKYA